MQVNTSMSQTKTFTPECIKTCNIKSKMARDSLATLTLTLSVNTKYKNGAIRDLHVCPCGVSIGNQNVEKVLDKTWQSGALAAARRH